MKIEPQISPMNTVYFLSVFIREICALLVFIVVPDRDRLPAFQEQKKVSPRFPRR
jgi:hypothetical protein